MWKAALLSVISYRTAERLKDLIALVLYYSGIAHLVGRFRNPGAAILVYHSVGGDGVFHDNVVSVRRFEEQIAFLARHRRIVPLNAIVDRLERGESVPPDWVALTFDDGYRDNATHALPILLRHEAVASFFVTWNVVGGAVPFFYDRIEAAIRACARQEVVVRLPDGERRFRLATEAQCNEAVLRMVMAIRDKPDAYRNDFVEDLRRACGLDPDERAIEDLYLRIEDLGDLARAGMEIGSHTVTHPNLAVLDDTTLGEELRRSRALIEACVEHPVVGLAYPFGKARHRGARVHAAAQQAGYRYALTTEARTLHGNVDRYALPRIGVRDAHLARLKVNLLGVRI